MTVVEKIEDTARFAALKHDWNELLRNSDSDCLFLSWEWLFTWWTYFSEHKRLRITIVRRDGLLIAIVPLVLSSSQWKRLLPFEIMEFLGSGCVGSDYLDIPVRRGYESHAFAALEESFSKDKHMWELSRVKRSSSQVSHFASQIRTRGWAFTHRVTDVSPYIDLSGHDWESYLASIGTTHRTNLRRRLRKLYKQWDVRFEQVQCEEQRTEALKVMINLHNQRWQERGQPGAFHSAALKEFHEKMSRLALRNDWLRLFVLRLNNKPVAALYGFFYDKKFYYYQAGFSPEYSQYSVGLCTMALAVKHSIEEGARCYDFLHGDEQYKFLWTSSQHELDRLELYPPGLRGTLYGQMMNLRSNLKKMTLRMQAVADN